MAKPTLIPWADVPKGHRVWAREHSSPTGPWIMAVKGRLSGGLFIDGFGQDADEFDFCAAEQQPGEWAKLAAEIEHYRTENERLHAALQPLDARTRRDWDFGVMEWLLEPHTSRGAIRLGQVISTLIAAEADSKRLRDGLAALMAAICPNGELTDPHALAHLASAHRQDSEDADVREAKLERLRDGLAALEQKVHEVAVCLTDVLNQDGCNVAHHSRVEGSLDALRMVERRLAALREGQ